MTAYRISKHASQRMQQRALRSADIELIDRYGVETPTADSVLLTHKAVNAAVEKLDRDLRAMEGSWRKRGTPPTPDEAERARSLRSTIRDLDRLRCRKLVFDETGAILVTCYHSTRRNQRRSLRDTRSPLGRRLRRGRSGRHRRRAVPVR